LAEPIRAAGVQVAFLMRGWSVWRVN